MSKRRTELLTSSTYRSYRRTASSTLRKSSKTRRVRSTTTRRDGEAGKGWSLTAVLFSGEGELADGRVAAPIVAAVNQPDTWPAVERVMGRT